MNVLCMQLSLLSTFDPPTTTLRAVVPEVRCSVVCAVSVYLAYYTQVPSDNLDPLQ